MTTIISRFRVALALGVLASTACGDDTIVNPTFGARCSGGSIAAGQSVQGAFNTQSCSQPYHFWSDNRVFYESYTVRLEAGRGYYFHLAQQPDTGGVNNVDALLVLYGKSDDGASIPLAVSDDNAGGPNGYDSEFYFIAPTSGTYQIVAATYDYTNLGGYRLSMERCPVVGTLDSAGVYTNLTFDGSSPCLRRDSNSGGYETPIVLARVPVALGENVGVSVAGNGFVPVIEMGGAGFDVYRNLYQGEYGSATGSPSVVNLLNATNAGAYTLMVGAQAEGASGTFSVTLTRSGGVAVVREGAGTPQLRLAPRPLK